MKFLLIAIFFIGCSAIAIKGDEKMILKGFGAKKAVFEDGSSIEKDTTLKVPDIITNDN